MLTPVRAADLDRLRLLRTSAEAVGVELDHVVVVDTEDAAVARRALPSSGHLHLVTTADVLDADVERARRRGRRRWRRTLPWNRWDRSGRALSGWWAQQLVKLGAGERLGLQEWLCVDADTAFVAPVTAGDLHDAQGRLHLQEWAGIGVGAGVRARHVDAARVLGLDPAGLDPELTYVGAPVPMHGAVVSRLLAHLGRDGRPWQRAFLDAGLTEYPLHGLWARHLDPGDDVVAVDQRLALQVYDADLATLPARLDAAVAQGARMLMLHSRLGVDADDYAALLRSRWLPAGRR
jgi:hypothetical protein